jgi:predicted hotdog family 3-hydroxylacyl-ACP dehydratase
MKLDHNAIASLIPHQGRMCLLDSVEHWDAHEITCTSAQHRRADNPLRSPHGLSCIHGIEFAAQAMAVHGGLNTAGDRPPRVGLLLSVRQCVFHRARLDDIDAPLSIEAKKIAGNDDTLSYRFSVRGGGALLLEGRANVMLRKGDHA